MDPKQLLVLMKQLNWFNGENCNFSKFFTFMIWKYQPNRKILSSQFFNKMRRIVSLRSGAYAYVCILYVCIYSHLTWLKSNYMKRQMCKQKEHFKYNKTTMKATEKKQIYHILKGFNTLKLCTWDR